MNVVDACCSVCGDDFRVSGLIPTACPECIAKSNGHKPPAPGIRSMTCFYCGITCQGKGIMCGVCQATLGSTIPAKSPQIIMAAREQLL